MSGLFLGQPAAFAAGAARVLLLGGRHPHDPYHAGLTAQVRHQRAQHLLAIDPVGLHPPRSLIHRNARRVKHIVRDPIRQQKPVEPKPVVACLVATPHRRHPSQRPCRPLAHRSTSASKPARSPPPSLWWDTLSLSGQCSVTSQLLWLSSTATKIVP